MISSTIRAVVNTPGRPEPAARATDFEHTDDKVWT